MNNFPLIVLIILAIVYAIVGYINGARKTLFYIVADIIITLIILVALSFVTIQKYYTTENLLFLLEKIFIIPNELQEYFLSPELSEIVYIITDIIVRLLLFIGIYPLTRFILKHTIFRKIIKNINEKYVKTRKTRLFGSLIGAIKGIFIAIIFVLPAILYEPISEDNKQPNEEIIVEMVTEYNYII